MSDKVTLEQVKSIINRMCEKNGWEQEVVREDEWGTILAAIRPSGHRVRWEAIVSWSRDAGMPDPYDMEFDWGGARPGRVGILWNKP